MPSLAELLRRPVPPRVHGGAAAGELAALGVEPSSVLDLSTSVNPYGPAPAVLRAIGEAVLDRYPDPTAARARAAIAASIGADPDQVVVGNGATELLWTLAHLLLEPGDTVLVCEPAFSELRLAAEAARARVVAWRALVGDGFVLDVDAVARTARAERAGLVALAAPGSPSGVGTPVAEVVRLARALPGVALVVDQSFLALSERHRELRATLPENVVCVRSLTKEHAIPGVRLGYALADPELAARIEALRPAWSVSGVAQAAAIAVSGEEAFVAASRERLLAERAALALALAERGFRVLASTTPYFVVEVGDAAAFRAGLLARHRILVRDCTSFGLPSLARLAARGGEAAERIVAAFADVAREPALRARR
jgi:histidinol-phosphate/aromatic aminotransferase/cobyric acid decarboxylase-like protein